MRHCVVKRSKVVFGRADKTERQGENAGCLHFLLFHTMLSKLLFFMVVKSPDCEVKSKPIPIQQNFGPSQMKAFADDTEF